jgi:hypothetical protein
VNLLFSAFFGRVKITRPTRSGSALESASCSAFGPPLARDAPNHNAGLELGVEHVDASTGAQTRFYALGLQSQPLEVYEVDQQVGKALLEHQIDREGLGVQNSALTAPNDASSASVVSTTSLSAPYFSGSLTYAASASAITQPGLYPPLSCKLTSGTVTQSTLTAHFESIGDQTIPAGSLASLSLCAIPGQPLPGQ